MSGTMYCDKPVSRRKALEAATQVIFHRRTTRDLWDNETFDAMSYEDLRWALEDMGMGPITPAEMSDIWRHSSYFAADLDEMSGATIP